jgi:queuine tRNA-ribosyltransferase
MHPGVGPLVEAQELYVRQSNLAGRLVASQERLVLFDVGLGAGSNALAAWLSSQAAPEGVAQLEIVSFERDLSAITLALENGERFGLVGEVHEAATAMVEHGEHHCERTLWRLQKGELLDCLARETAKADIVFWDPFSPKTNPSLWTVAAFEVMRRAAGEHATLFTYSASTTVRIALLLAGWYVGVGESIGDKRTTTVAAARLEDLRSPLDAAWLNRVTRAEARLPSDAGEDAVARVLACPQFADNKSIEGVF